MCERIGRGSRAIVRAMARSLAPRKVKFTFDAGAELTRFVDRFIGFLPRHVALVFPIGLWLINWGGLLFSGKPLTMMSADEGERYLRKIGGSPVFAVREGVKGLRSIILLGFYSHPEIQKHLGYFPQEWVDQKVAERVTRWGLRVPDLAAIAALPGGPAGVEIRGVFDEQLRPGGEPVDFRAAYTQASEAEVKAARRDAEAAAARLAERERKAAPAGEAA